MRSLKFNLSKQNLSGWDAAVLLTEAYLRQNLKANQLLDLLPSTFASTDRSICQSLFLGGLRHGHTVRDATRPLAEKGIRPHLEAILLVAGYELIAADSEKTPKIVHHAIERSKQSLAKAELGFLNALLRKLPDAIHEIKKENNPAAFFSHPGWLVEKWQKEFGLDVSRQLLNWNQQIPSTYIKLYQTPEKIPSGLEVTEWPQFYRINSNISWSEDLHPLLNRGIAYIKDPSTRLAPELLSPKQGECVLDVCAAPGGKAYDLAHAMNRQGHLVAVDLPSPRIGRLRENLEHLQSNALKCDILEKDLLELSSEDFESAKLPILYDAVMLDVPCSNTGVIQRRTDVKWRLRPGDIKRCTRLQKVLLEKAAQFVRPGGRLVYSTCSIETAENRAVVDTFLRTDIGKSFSLKDKQTSYPWQTGHDGAGAFLLIKS
jgi:16S rRNA (cytosine967-C5)-methyltransferase